MPVDQETQDQDWGEEEEQEVAEGRRSKRPVRGGLEEQLERALEWGRSGEVLLLISIELIVKKTKG